MKLKLTEDQYGRLFEENNTIIYKVLKSIFERNYEISFVHCKGTSYEYDTLIKDKTTDISYSEYELDGTTWPIDDLVEIISDLTGYDDKLIAEFLNKYIQTEFNKKDYYGYNKLNEQEILNDKIYYLLKKVFNSNFDLKFENINGTDQSYVLITPKNAPTNDIEYYYYYSHEDFISDMQNLTGFNDKIIQDFHDKYIGAESNKLSENKLNEQEILSNKTYQVIKKIFERNFTLEHVTYDRNEEEIVYIINLNNDDGYSESEYNLNEFFDELGDLTGYNWKTIQAFYNAYLKDEMANNITRTIKETNNIIREELFDKNMESKPYKILEKIFERTYELELDPVYADTWDIKFKGTDDYTTRYAKNLQELSGFSKELVDDFLDSYVNDKINIKYKLKEQQTDKSYNVLKKYFNRHFDLMHDEYGTYVLYRDKEDDEDSTDFKFYVDEEGWYGVLSDIKSDTGFDKTVIHDFIISYSDELYRNEENSLNEEIKINRTPNLLTVKIIEDKEDIGEITFESEDGIEYTIIDAEIKPDFRNKGFYKKAIIDILKKYPDIKIISIFRSKDADNAWNSLINKLPTEYKVEKKEHEAENAIEYKLSLNEGLDPSKKYKVIIKYLLAYFEPVMAIDPYKFTEKVIFFYKDDAEREEDYELYLWDNQSHIITMVSIISNITGYDRSIVHDVIQKYIKNINKYGMKYINEGISDKLTNKIVNKLLDKYNVDYKNNLLHFYTKDNNRINGDKVYDYICDIIGVNEDYELEKADEIYNEFIKKTLQGKSINEGVSDDKIKNLLIKLIDKNYEYDGYGIRNKSTKDYINYSTISSFLSKITGYNMGYIRYIIKDYLDNNMKKINEAEIDADGNLIDFDYEEETDAEFETSNFSFILDKVENGEVYGDFTFKKIDLRFPIVMKPEGDTYRIGFPDDNIEQDFMGAANHFRLGKEYNQFIRHILNTLLK